MFAYADALAAHKRRHPADDVMSALVHAEIEGEKVTGEELMMFFFLLVIAGTDTTRSALPGGVLALAEHPDAYPRLRGDRALLGPAIEEMLRWHPPVLSFRRTATRDVELAGTMVRAGDKVVVYHVSAHYDEREFRDPLGFDVARAPNRTSPSAAARTSAWAQDCATLPGHTAAGVRSGRAQAGNTQARQRSRPRPRACERRGSRARPSVGQSRAPTTPGLDCA